MLSYEVFYQATAAIFLLLIIGLLVRDRKHLERNGLMLMRKTERGKEIIDKIAKSNASLWENLGTLGVVLGFLGMALGTYMISKVVIEILFFSKSGVSGPSLVLPSFSPETSISPGILQIPFWFWLMGIISVVFVHEGMHAVQMRIADVKIKSSGIMFLAVIPGAFVEPDEDELKKKGFMQRQRVYAGGSLGNFMLSLLVLLVVSFIMIPLFFTPAIPWAHLSGNETYPAKLANMTGWITSINGGRTDELSDIQRIMASTKPGQTINVLTTDGSYDIKLAANPAAPERGFMGIGYFPDKSFMRPIKSRIPLLNEEMVHVVKKEYNDTLAGFLISSVFGALFWMWILNFGIGVMNLIPLKPLDGGLMFEAVMEKYAPKHGPKVAKAVSGVMLAILVSSLLLSFLSRFLA